jgi:hypothetical protein
MREATAQLLEQLQKAPWFTAIGQPLAEPDVVRLTKWMDAVAAASDPWWEMLGYQQAIALREAAAADPEAEARWGQVEKELEAQVRALVARQVAPLRAERGFPAQAEMVLGHHLRHALLETEFLDLSEPGYFGEFAQWVLRGRMPCGVDERGQMLIY